MVYIAWKNLHHLHVKLRTSRIAAETLNTMKGEINEQTDV